MQLESSYIASETHNECQDELSEGVREKIMPLKVIRI